MLDFNILSQLKQLCPHSQIIIDNTWLSSVLFNPFNFSKAIDMVVVSLTKHYSGGRCIAGAVLGPSGPSMNSLHNFLKFTGVHVSPQICLDVLVGLENMTERVNLASKKMS